VGVGVTDVGSVRRHGRGDGGDDNEGWPHWRHDVREIKEKGEGH
jgi:hypothetical protein